MASVDSDQQRARPPSILSGVGWRKADYIFAAILGGVYFIVLAGIDTVDVYNIHFFGTRWVYLYNAARFLFALYLIVLAFWAGAGLLDAAIRRLKAPPLTAWQRAVVSVLIGAMVWHVAMLLFGHLSLLRWTFLAAVTTAAVFASGRALRQSALAVFAEFEAWRTGASKAQIYLAAGVGVLAFLMFGLVVATKGLYPGGGHDYYLHYHQYYLEVLESHSLLPQSTWYHYFYTKGMAFNILGAVLTDPVGVQLGSLAFFMIALAAVFEMVRRSGAGPVPALATVALTCLLYSYTPGSEWVADHGAWGQFQKNHLTNSALLVALAWVCSEIVRAARPSAVAIWSLAGAAVTITAGLVSIQAVLLGGVVFVALLAYYAVRRDIPHAAAFFGLGCAGAAVIFAILLLNFVVTGIPSDQFVLELWPLIHLERTEEIGWLHLLLHLHRTHTQLEGAVPPELFTEQTANLTWHVFRWQLVGPLFLYGLLPLAVAAAAWASRRRPGFYSPMQPQAVLPALFLGATLLAMVGAGLSQPDSFVRYASFTLFMWMVLAGCLWGWIFRIGEAGWPRRVGAGAMAVALAAFTVTGAYFVSSHYSRMRPAVIYGAGFTLGRLSLYEAYKLQDMRTGLPWGAVEPSALAAWLIVGPDEPIKDFHIHTYCMLPHCRVQSWPSQALGDELWALSDASPAEARALLQRNGLNNFLYVQSLDVADLLPNTSLFAPDNIGDYLGVRWTNGDGTLLTWLGPGVTPLSPEWIEAYAAEANAVHPLNSASTADQADAMPTDADWGWEWEPVW